jgi:histone-lysine N-methyltransferase SETMAR
VNKEFVPERKTANAVYKGLMDRLLKRIQGVRPVAFCSRDFFVLHVNAPAHKAASVCQFLTQKMLPLSSPPPPYSPDLSPPDYFIFSNLKMKLKGHQFAVVAVIQEAVTDESEKV